MKHGRGREVGHGAFLEALVAAADGMDASLRSYSGRGMNGKSCVGVDLDGSREAFRLAALLALELGEEPPTPQEDSMGRGIILYWSDVPFQEEIEDEEVSP